MYTCTRKENTYNYTCSSENTKSQYQTSAYISFCSNACTVTYMYRALTIYFAMHDKDREGTPRPGSKVGHRTHQIHAVWAGWTCARGATFRTENVHEEKQKDRYRETQ